MGGSLATRVDSEVGECIMNPIKQWEKRCMTEEQTRVLSSYDNVKKLH